jgi:hypothetical protein
LKSRLQEEIKRRAAEIKENPKLLVELRRGIAEAKRQKRLKLHGEMTFDYVENNITQVGEWEEL